MAVNVSGGAVTTLQGANRVMEHNHIHHFGLCFKQGAGISLGDVANKALHNEIHEGPRYGIQHNGNCN